MRTRLIAASAALAAAALGSLSASAVVVDGGRVVRVGASSVQPDAAQTPRDQKAVNVAPVYRRTSGSRGWERRAGPGWTNRHVQRMAAKKRNQARHRAATKGK